MKKINSRRRFQGLPTTIAAMALALFGMSSCEKNELEEDMPDWLGASIYEYLEDEGFDTYVRIINDLDYKEVLSKTGSKTLFVADEEAVQRFYKSGYFKMADGVTPVSCYEELSMAQKKLLLYGAMLNNVYQVAMLSSTEGTPPVQGDAMRRVASSSIWDTVPKLTPEIMPNNSYWKVFRDNNRTIRCMTDETNKPMVIFNNKFLTMKKITNDDYDFLFNQGNYPVASPSGRPGRQPQDASINGVKIKEQNIKCLNGFINVMEDVIYPLPNMAEYLNINENTTIYNALLRRFCAPYYQFGDLNNNGRDMTREYNRLYPDDQVDTLWQMRFLSERTHSGSSTDMLGSDTYGRVYSTTAKDLLKFDPGWSSFYSTTSSTTTSNVALQQNMAVMLVPDDKAMAAWWITGAGAPLRERYGTGSSDIIEDMSGVPNKLIIPLLRNNMLNSFVGSVPSKFASVLDSNNDPMMIETSNVDSVKMCCNGAIYFTNYVFSPADYKSVSFPTISNESLEILDWAIKNLEFDAYLNSMVARYSFFVPQARMIGGVSEKVGNRPVLLYRDPVSEGDKYTQMFAFYYTPEGVRAAIFSTDEAGNPLDVLTASATTAQIKDRLEDLLDYHVIIGDVEDGYTYYQTKGRGTVKIDFSGADSLVFGGYQIEKNAGLKIIKRFDMTADGGNGRTYLIDEPIATSYRSVFDVLSDSENYPKFSTFFDLMSRFFENERNSHAVGGTNVNTFNTYHYTVYVPSNDAIDPMIRNYEILDRNQIAELEEYYEDLTTDEEAYNIAMERLSKALRTDIVKNLQATKYPDAHIWNPADSKYNAFWNEAKALLDAEPQTEEDTSFVHTYYTDMLTTTLDNFVKYHIQDNSVYVGGEFKIDTIHVSDVYAHYETAYMNEKSQFEKLAVRSFRNGGITMKDVLNKEHNVVTSDKRYYNIMCREYEYNAKSRPDQLETSSYAVIHMIDTPLDNGVEFTYYKF